MMYRRDDQFKRVAEQFYAVLRRFATLDAEV